MKLANYDENKIIKGWYSTEVHSDIPEPTMEVSDKQWITALSEKHNKVDIENNTTFRTDIRTNEEILQDIRTIRNERLKTEVDPIVSNFLRWNDLNEDQQIQLKEYRQALLDVTDQPEFPLVTWPTNPL